MIWRKKIGLVMLVFCFGLELGAITYNLGYVLGLASSTTFTISGGVYPGAPSYTVWVEGSYYYAKDHAGVLKYSGTNASQITQNVIDILTVGSEGSGYAVDAGGSILFIGNIIFDSPLDVTLRKGIIFRGQAQFFTQKANLTFNVDTIGIDLTGSSYMLFENIEFTVGAGHTPQALFLLARESSGRSAGWHTFRSVGFYAESGYATSALIYDYGSEQNTFDTCVFGSRKRAITITRSNVDSLTSPFVNIITGLQSTSMIRFINVDFHRSEASATGELILIYESVWSVYFQGSYFAGTNLPAVNITGGGNYVFDSCRFETIPFLTSMPNGDVSGLALRNIGWYTNAGVILDFNKTNHSTYGLEISGIVPRYNMDYSINLYNLVASDINLIHAFIEMGADDSNMFLNVQGNLSYSHIYTKNSTLLDVVGTTTHSNITYLP